MAADRANCNRCTDCLIFVAHETYRNVCRACHCPADSHCLLSKAGMPACGKSATSWPGGCNLSDDVHIRDNRETGKMATGSSMGDFAWIPAGVEPDVVLHYFANLPATKVPYVGSAGERYRLEQLERQLPPHDRATAAAGCSSSAADSPTAAREELGSSFWERRTSEAAGRGRVVVLTADSFAQRQPFCKECNGPMKSGDVAVLASRHFGADTYWHPACFVCKTCRELLVDMTYFVHAGDGAGIELELFCGRHHAERLKPRCAACDEIIFADECTEAEDRCWHISHFCCFECGTQLGGCRYVMHDGRPHCCSCFERRFAAACSTCHQRIGVVQGHMMHGDTRWHATAECFRCHFCSKSLLGEAFLPKADGAIFCSMRCCDAAAVSVMRDSRPFEEGSRALSPSHHQPPQPAGDERWTEDAGSRLLGSENFSEGYGSLRNCPSLLRRSLPDVTAASLAESSGSEDDERGTAASSRLANRRGSDKSAMSFRQQRRLAFELRRSCRRRRSEATSGKSRQIGKAEADRQPTAAAATTMPPSHPAAPAATEPPPPKPFVGIIAGYNSQRPPPGPVSVGRAATAAAIYRPHFPTSASAASFLHCSSVEPLAACTASSPARPPAPRMGNLTPPVHTVTNSCQQLPIQQQQPKATRTASPVGDQPMQPRFGPVEPPARFVRTPATKLHQQQHRTNEDDGDDDGDDGYQEGGSCRHAGGVCPLCTSGSSSSSSDDEDVAYEEEVERSRGLRVARDLSRRRTSLPAQRLLSRQVSARVVQATTAKTAKQRRTKSGNCVVQ